MNSFTSLFAGCIIFCTLGFMSETSGIPIEDVAESGPGLAFVAYPKALSTMPLSPLWSVLFFAMLFLLGLDSQFVGVEGLVSSVADIFPGIFNSRRPRILLTIGSSIVCFLVGLLMVTNTKGNETSQLPPTFPIRGAGGDDNDNVPDDNRNDVIAFKLFVDNLTKRYFDSPSWIAGGNGPPSDGSITEADCAFPFLSRWFGVTCVVGNWIFAMGILVIIAIPVVAIVLAYFRRRLREAEKLTRKPYEELCALLADVNFSSTLQIPLSDIVINRRIGDGAFGLVYGGEAKSAGRWEAVAVKMNTNRTTYEAKVEFLSEAKLMRDLRHKNVVRLVGVCMDRPQDEIYLIMELMLLGDLKKYLLERRLTAQR
ncbi:unnamed protein product [Rodentolepis nana]|uniref:Protein kinase domain-containing protein n=1 Tax=Rodentolepis nana TaxID=102285 RepID=A0A0R3T9F2_RODNA|nr:unnamed protein product [Rodentolepis nana]